MPTYVASALGAPIDGGGVLNIAKAGSTLPFKFSVTANGVPVTTLSAATATSSALACSSSVVTDVVESYSSEAGTLVNNGDGSYQYNYKTLKAWSGTCRTLALDLGSGLIVSAAFSFR